ncbi:unnamed protein product (macronuclear) [Paramecium tetraurelia]|uniref:Uncharacterized protein n=1 Tax=Paramecium tetraurelia TaxID=5888 RepID=A0BT19_PARTE|nr:uncharacterized protein GSPATT00031918001 [Paramecium tetraurelia]CAK61686.1 unnamed protein product [Paramecium tetraurelia]|eukprot:XP_001429084.1 hypothetical protein (macronuclear) [Paramecium tetraurelia strain d4-2]
MYQTDPRQQQPFQQNNIYQSSPIQSQYLSSPGIAKQYQQSPQNPIIQSPQTYQPQQQFGSQYQIPSSQQFLQQPQLRQPQLQSNQILPVTSQAFGPVQPQSPITVRPSYQQMNFQVAPPVQQVVVQQPVTVQPQTQVQEFRHVERPLQVITVDEIEAPWRLKCATLERQILELQIQIRKNNGTIVEETVQEIQDDTKVKNLELQKLELEQKIHDDEQFMNELRMRLEELRQEYEVIITEKVTYASNEVETWMKKYGNLEKSYAESNQKIADLKRQLAQVEAADKAMQDQKKSEARSEVRRSSKMY